MQISRRVFLVGVAALATFPALHARSSDASSLSAGRRAPTLIGYGIANNWHRIDAELFARLLAVNGLTLTEIEYVAWLDGSDGIKTDVEAAARFVTAMRSYDVTTFVNVVNWNSEAQRNASEDWFGDRVREIRDRIGPSQVILQPVSEGGADLRVARWQDIARTEWPGRLVLYADRAQVPPSPVVANVPHGYLDVHYCDYGQMLDVMRTAGPRVINNTDCTPLVASNLGLDRAVRLTRQALDYNTNLLVYDWERATIDQPLIQAMGAEVRR